VTDNHPKTAVILVNLGTPDAPTPAAVRRYLGEFLWDRRVIEGRGLRRALWWLLLNLVILRLRPRKVARLYQKIWKQDSPMRQILNQQVASLQLLLQKNYPDSSPQVFSAMTYGDPSLTRCLLELSQSGYKRMLVMPLYPQYSATSTAPIYDRVARFQQNSREVCDIRIVKEYHDHPLYIEALAQSVRAHWQAHPPAERLLLSFHGIPKAYADQGDPYPKQCLKTAELLARKLNLIEGAYLASFQSRFGPAEWVQPYTDAALKGFAQQGITSVDVISPAFSADCLETLEEIAIQNRELFEKAGGEVYRYIPALNNSQAHIHLLAALVDEQAGHWLSTSRLSSNSQSSTGSEERL
jgi:ferrochelatase